MSPTFMLTSPPELGILSAEVRKLRLQVLGNNKHAIRIDLAAECPAHVLYDRIEAATSDIARSMLRVSQVGIKVTFELRKDEKKHRTRSFEITSPNSCSLQNDGYDVVIQRMLADNGIEPRLPQEDESNGGQAP